MKRDDDFIEFEKFKKMIIRFGYDKIYTGKIKPISNSAHINCCKGFKGQEALVFVLKKK
jgi:putative transposon-encoded protein